MKNFRFDLRKKKTRFFLKPNSSSHSSPGIYLLGDRYPWVFLSAEFSFLMIFGALTFVASRLFHYRKRPILWQLQVGEIILSS